MRRLNRGSVGGCGAIAKVPFPQGNPAYIRTGEVELRRLSDTGGIAGEIDPRSGKYHYNNAVAEPDLTQSLWMPCDNVVNTGLGFYPEGDRLACSWHRETTGLTAKQQLVEDAGLGTVDSYLNPAASLTVSTPIGGGHGKHVGLRIYRDCEGRTG